MITITIDGKTYKQSDGSKEWIIKSILGWTKDGTLEEVKENKERTPEEIMDLVHKRPHPTLSVTVTPAEYEDMKKQYEESWTPTPGQMIEVSYDGEKWEEEKYTFMRMKGNYYECTKGSTWYVWKFARPITEEVIVPEYTAPQMYADGGRHKVGGPTAEQKQLEAITQWIHSQSNK